MSSRLRFRMRSLVVAGMLWAILLPAASAPRASETGRAADPIPSAEPCERPEELVFSEIPRLKGASADSGIRELVALLSSAVGLPVRYAPARDYARLVFALWEDEVDIAILGPYSYVTARRRDPSIIPFATYALRAGPHHAAGSTYRSVLVVLSDGDTPKVEDLRGRSLGLVDSGSTSGNMIPRRIFASGLGQELEAFFGRVVYTGAHDLSIQALAHGSLDAIFVSDYHVDQAVRDGVLDADRVRVVWASPSLPHDPFVFREELCPDIRSAIADALLTPDQGGALADFLRERSLTGLVAAYAHDYDWIESIAPPALEPIGAVR